MAAFKRSAPPLFLTEITENKYLLLEKTLPACCPHLTTPALKDSQAQDSHGGQQLACLLNSSSFSIHMYSAKGLSSSWECPLIITSSLMMLGLVLLRLGSFMAASLIWSAIKKGGN